MNECAAKTLKHKKRPMKNRRHSKPWYYKKCKILRRQFEQLAKHVQKFPKNPHTLGHYNKIKRKYKHTIKTIKQKWEIENIRVLENLSSNLKLFWQHIKKLRGKTNNSLNQVDSIPPKKWIEHFSSLFNVTENDKNKLEGSNKTPSDNKHNATLDSLFTKEEISKGIRELKLRKASGNDSIGNEIIIAGAPTILPFLVSFLNEILKSHYYPENWYKGIIKPIHKQGEIDNPDNYRGITINSCLSKLFNLLLTKPLTTFTNDNQILKYNQIGFWKGFRTSDHVFNIKTVINEYLKENKKLCLCFVDFRKAYDSIWREALFYKLSAYYDVSTNL